MLRKTLLVACLAWGCSDGGSLPAEAGANDASIDVNVVDVSVDGGSSDSATGVDAAIDGWTLTWSDEFNSGTSPDPASWTFTSIGTSTSGPGWGEEYDQPSAVTVGNGVLTITATQATDGGVVSGAIDTKGKFQQAYGRFEARMKAPPGAGIWPAFWLMGDTNGKGWPTCGEIDIVEIVGSDPKTSYATVHSGNTNDVSANTSTGGKYTASANLSDDFHVYAVEWSASSMTFTIDDILYETITPQTMTSGELWAFDHEFYVLLDLAIGGSWPGPPNASTFPAKMLVDWVRVYTKSG